MTEEEKDSWECLSDMVKELEYEGDIITNFTLKAPKLTLLEHTASPKWVTEESKT